MTNIQNMEEAQPVETTIQMIQMTTLRDSQIKYLREELCSYGLLQLNVVSDKYRILYEVQGSKRVQELFDADIILTFIDNTLGEKSIKINSIFFQERIIFYKITERSRLNKNIISLIVSNIFTPNIKIKILLIENEVVMKPYLTFVNNTFYSQGVKGGILRYYFDKYDLDERIFKIITIMSCQKVKLFGGAVRDIIKGIPPKDLDFYANHADEDNYHCLVILENLGFKVECVNNNKNITKIGNKDKTYGVKKYNVYDKNDNSFIISMDFANKKFITKVKDFDVNSLILSSMYSITLLIISNNIKNITIENTLESLTTNTACAIYRKSSIISHNVLMLYRIQKMISYGYNIVNSDGKQLLLTDFAKDLQISYIESDKIYWIKCKGCICKNCQHKGASGITYYKLEDCREHFENCSICSNRGVGCIAIHVKSKKSNSNKATKNIKS